MAGRFDQVAQIADLGLSDEESADLVSTPDSTFGDEQGDYAPPTIQTDVHTSSWEDLQTFYDNGRPEAITILHNE
jgi:hypothetical protein